MALQTFEKEGYGQVELNLVAFVRDGRIAAQVPLDAAFTAAAPAENGMILEVDELEKTVIKPVASSLNPVALNYSAEHLYDESTIGLKDFSLAAGDVYPRLGYLAVGDKFTTNTIQYDDGDYADDEALLDAIKAGTPVYGVISTTGYILAVDTAPGTVDRLLLKAVKAYTMPDGQPGIKWQVIAA